MHGRRALLFIAGGTTCVLAALIGAYVVLTAFRPEVEIRRMLVAMTEVQTVSERSAFSWTRGEGSDRATTTLYVTGQLDVFDPSAIGQATKFRLFRLRRGEENVDLSGEIRVIGGTSYLTYAPPGPKIESVDFSKSGTWVSFLPGELPQWGAVIPGLDDPIRDQGTGNKEQETGWTADGLVRLRGLLSRADIFIVAYDDVTEVISGHATRVIDGRFDPDALRSFLRDAIRARENREPTTEERLAVETLAKALEKLDVRFWIGIDDHLLYRVQAAGAVPDANVSSSNDNLLVPFDLIVELSDFNEPFEGNAPSNAISFSSLFERQFGAHSASAAVNDNAVLLPDEASLLPTQKSGNAMDSDNDGLSNALETFYRTNPNVADTDGDGTSDGEEVLNGKNPRGDGTLFGFGIGE